MSITRLLSMPSDIAGVGSYRPIWPSQEIQKKFSNDFYVEINTDFVNDINYYKQFDIIHFHRQFGPYETMDERIKELQKHGVVFIMDIDDYWIPPKTHPMYLAAVKEKLAEKITAGFKSVDYVTTTTDIFARHIKKYNSNVQVIPNAIDMNNKMWNDVDTQKTNKLRIGWIGGSCCSSDTEVLTNEGYKLFSELNGNETIACLNPDSNVLEYHKPFNYIKTPFKGELQCGKNNLIDYAVTPNHNMYVSIPKSLTKKELNFELIQSEKV